MHFSKCTLELRASLRRQSVSHGGAALALASLPCGRCCPNDARRLDPCSSDATLRGDDDSDAVSTYIDALVSLETQFQAVQG